jgi:hypothetical protein
LISDLALYLWQSLIILSFCGLTKLYTGGKGSSLSVSAGWPYSILEAKVDSLPVTAGWSCSTHWQRLTTFFFCSLTRLYISGKG